MALVFRFPTFHPSSYFNRAPRGYDFFHDLWREVVLANAYEQQVGDYCCPQTHQGSVKIASVLLGQYKPEEISVEVDSEKVTLHGLHRIDREDGFEESEFKRFRKLPQGVDPTSVTSRVTQDGAALVIEGTKRVEEKANDDKFEAKLDFRGFKPEEIKIQMRGNELTITGKQVSEGHRSRDCSRRILLPDGVDLSSLTSRLSKEGLLTIEATRDPALLPQKRSVEVTMEKDEAGKEPKQTTSADAEETEN
ncbi:hypothetical protein ACROYT_G040055 [Oculina patagonica]